MDWIRLHAIVLTLLLDAGGVNGFPAGTVRGAVAPPSSRSAAQHLLEPDVLLQDSAHRPVARFRPGILEAAEWRLAVVTAGGEEISVFAGTGAPPAEIAWDGHTLQGSYAWAGMSHTWLLTTCDILGHVSHVVGPEFVIPSYVREDGAQVSVLFSARDLAADGQAGWRPAGTLRPGAAAAPARPGSVPGRDEDLQALLPRLERAARLIDRNAAVTLPVRLEVLAPTEQEARELALIAGATLDRVLAGPAERIQLRAGADPAAPPGGTVLVTSRPRPSDGTP
ncbi:MAG: hypothetical protein R6X25_03365 [Candidatus Krumholzibacteriia bacterium]